MDERDGIDIIITCGSSNSMGASRGIPDGYILVPGVFGSSNAMGCSWDPATQWPTCEEPSDPIVKAVERPVVGNRKQRRAALARRRHGQG